jgi:hypothetical protein
MSAYNDKNNIVNLIAEFICFFLCAGILLTQQLQI